MRSAGNGRRAVILLAVAGLFLGGALFNQVWLEETAGRAITDVSPRQSARRGSPQSTADAIAQSQARLRQNPQDANGYAQLGLLLLQQVRMTGDAAAYGRADQALTTALTYDPNQVDAMLGKGVLALALHDFHGAIAWANQARAINPYRAAFLGILTDAYVELGDYTQATAALEEMIHLRPDLESYTRYSYLAELRGDVDTAIAAMQAALDLGRPGDEPTLWTQVQLAHLHFNRGDLASAEAGYRAALAQDAAYAYARAGLARVRAAQGHPDEAIETYRQVVARMPLPESAIALGELLEAAGRPAAAQEQYDLVRLMQTLNRAAGMNMDLEMALFEVEHGVDPVRALIQAQAAYQARPTIFAADVLAWALYHNGRYAEAAAASAEALRLGAQDARLYYHAGMIALAQDDRAAARDHLQQALAINPYFSPLDVPKARAALAALAE